ncbi:MAG: hypothetical protein QM692_09050 [Thermomicrobiales bacterium]
METRGFDELVKRVSRRATLGVMGAVAAGVAGGATVAAKKKKKKACPECRARKKGKCKGVLPDGAACVGGVCEGGVCVSPAVCGAGGPCTVFLSSEKVQGNLGGLSGADAKCQSLASAAGLPGSYKAWLSDDTSSPSSRFFRSSGPYVLIDGTVVANSWADLADGTPLLATIKVTETGGDYGDTSNAWSNTTADGVAISSGDPGEGSCTNWSSNANNVSGGFGSILSKTDWSMVTTTSFCINRLHLYCFQQS